MPKTALSKVKKGKVLGIRGKRTNLRIKNAYLLKRVEELHLREDDSTILNVDKNGAVTNLNYNDPKHIRWLED